MIANSDRHRAFKEGMEPVVGVRAGEGRMAATDTGGAGVRTVDAVNGQAEKGLFVGVVPRKTPDCCKSVGEGFEVGA